MARTNGTNDRVILVSFMLNAVLIALVVFGLAQAGWIGPGRSQLGLLPSINDARIPAAALGVEESVARASPAIVGVIGRRTVVTRPSVFDNFGFRDFFEEFDEEERETSAGTGFIVSPDGLVVTNRHVVSDPEARYQVIVGDEGTQTYDARVVALDPQLDIALLRIQTTGLPYLSFGDSDQLRPGQTVIAIGNPLGELRNSVSVGVVSGLSRSIVAGDPFGQSEVLEEVIQTDAAINPGNSGGPLLNVAGQVVGVNVAVARGSENIGFALPANAVRGVVESVLRTGEIVRPYLGIRYTQVTPALAERNNLPVSSGVLVVRGSAAGEPAVTPGSPAGKAGVLENDIILEIDGIKLDGRQSLAALIRQHTVGDVVRLKLWSSGREKMLTVQLERFR